MAIDTEKRKKDLHKVWSPSKLTLSPFDEDPQQTVAHIL